MNNLAWQVLYIKKKITNFDYLHYLKDIATVKYSWNTLYYLDIAVNGLYLADTCGARDVKVQIRDLEF